MPEDFEEPALPPPLKPEPMSVVSELSLTEKLQEEYQKTEMMIEQLKSMVSEVFLYYETVFIAITDRLDAFVHL